MKMVLDTEILGSTETGNFLTSQKTTNFSRKDVHNGGGYGKENNTKLRWGKPQENRPLHDQGNEGGTEKDIKLAHVHSNWL